jgi:hypothetical protein
VLTDLTFTSSNNLTAIAQAQDAFAEGAPACDRAALWLADGAMIWEADDPRATPEVLSLLLRP